MSGLYRFLLKAVIIYRVFLMTEVYRSLPIQINTEFDRSFRKLPTKVEGFRRILTMNANFWVTLIIALHCLMR